MLLGNFKKKIFSLFEKKGYSDINPDEIFLDSKNLPQFDTYQFEGRIERPIPWSTFSTLSVFCIILILFLLYKVWYLEIKNGRIYREISQNNSLRHDIIVAPRGIIYDRNGIPLVWNGSKAPGEDFPQRMYLRDQGLAHLLGFIKYPAKDASGFYYNEEYQPQDGVEQFLNEMVRGENGLKITETDAALNIVSESIIDKPQEGQNVYLAADSRIQAKMYEEISSLARQVGFKGGAGILMDVNTGEIVAMTSFPEYDSQTMTDGNDDMTIKSYSESDGKPFLNRVISGLYAPGSVVKPFLAFGALEEGIISPEKTIVSTGKLVVPNPYFPDKPSIFLDWKAHGPVDMRRALAVSSDVYFYEVAGGFGDQKGLGIANIDKYFRMFGFGAVTGTGISREEVGNIPSPEWKAKVFNGEPWRLGDTYNTAIGQYGMQVTPIQVVRAIAAIANGGVLVEPTFLKQATTTAPKEDGLEKRIGGNPEHYKIVREGMRLSVTFGTSKGLDMGESVHLAGKTGTAQLGVLKTAVNSWTTGFFPYEHPRYAYLVVMESGPAANLTGATFVMRQVMDWMAIYTPEYLK